MKVFYASSPKVWAVYIGRALELKRFVDRMFVILPFEKAFFKKFDFDVDYVGNPVLDAVKAFKADVHFPKKNAFLTDKKIFALLPGSRKMELKRIVPLMAEVAKANPQYQFAVAAIRALPGELYGALNAIPSVKFIFDATYDLLLHAEAAIVTSGTATLETGIFKVPQVVVYKAGSVELSIIRKMVKVPFISLINLIAGKVVVKELIQEHAVFEPVNLELLSLVENGSYRQKILVEYQKIYQILDTGSASDNAARLMVKYLSDQNV